MSIYYDPNTNYSGSDYFTGPNWHGGYWAEASGTSPAGRYTGLALRNGQRLAMFVTGMNYPDDPRGQCLKLYFNDDASWSKSWSINGSCGDDAISDNDPDVVAHWKPVTKGVWLDFVFRFVWAPGQDGQFQMWVQKNGGGYREVVSTIHTPTLAAHDAGGGNLVSGQIAPFFGIYRPRSITQDETIWMDEIRRGASFADVAIPSSTVTKPANTAAPAITGTTVAGQTLGASNGSWSGSPTSFAYQWQRCDATGAACANLGAANQSYVVQPADIGQTLRVVVTASNAAGSASATSAPTAPVQASTAPGDTFGRTTVGALSTPGGANFLDVSGPYNLPTAATVSSLIGYIGGGASNTPIRGPRLRRCRRRPGRARGRDERGDGPAVHAGSLDRARVPGHRAPPAGPVLARILVRGQQLDRVLRQRCRQRALHARRLLVERTPAEPVRKRRDVQERLLPLCELRPRPPARSHQHDAAGDHRHRRPGADADSRQGQLERRPDELRVPVAKLRRRRGRLHRHRRRDRVVLRSPGRRTSVRRSAWS